MRRDSSAEISVRKFVFAIAGFAFVYAGVRLIYRGSDWYECIQWPNLQSRVGLSFFSWLIWRQRVRINAAAEDALGPDSLVSILYPWLRGGPLRRRISQTRDKQNGTCRENGAQ